MLLTASTRDFFGVGDRRRGQQILSSVNILNVTENGMIAMVRGSGKNQYRVVVDFSELDRDTLPVHCDCPRFEDGFACKHLWATLKTFDLEYQGMVSIPPDIQLCDTDVEEFLAIFGSDFDLTSKAGRFSGGRGNRKSRRQNAQAIPEWQTALARINQTLHSIPASTTGGLPTDRLPESAQQFQYWFVLSISDPSNSDGMCVVAMQSTRKRDGDWSRPVAIELTSDDLAGIEDPDEHYAFSLLTAESEYRERSYYGYYGRDSGSRLYSVEQGLIGDTIAALHRTGRLVWKVGDSRQHFEDARPVDSVSSDVAGAVQIRIATDAENDAELIVTVDIVLRNNESQSPTVYSIDQLIWVSRIGCALLQEPASDSSIDPERKSDSVDSGEFDPGPRTRMITLSPHDCAMLKAWQATQKVRVPRESLANLLQSLSANYGAIELHVEDTVNRQVVTPQPIGTCLLEQHAPGSDHFQVLLAARYGETSVAFDSPIRWWYEPNDNQICIRDWQSEDRWLSSLDAEKFQFSASGISTQMTLPPEHFVDVVETLTEGGWEVTADGAMVRIASSFDIQVASGVDWFDLEAEVQFDELSANLPTLLESIQNGRRTVKLSDGTVGMLPEEWAAKFISLQDSGETVDDSLRFHRSQGLLLDMLLEKLPEVNRDRQYKNFLRRIKQFDGIKPVSATKSFCGELREYQQHGLGWMRFLQNLGFGGCLADDMGLGKTIQVLALLDARRKRRLPEGQSRKPSIVVVPKSLVFNWMDESQKFAPKLRVRNHTGTARKANWDELAENPSAIDVLLTTYGTMRIDAPLLAQMQFDYAILDEAQAIKNPTSLVARASRLISAEHRLVMTGTPVENHLGDLWSLFDFLNPGMLGKVKSNSGRLPDMTDELQRRQVEQISKSMRPFILRRTKSEVLTELPEKVEQTLSCAMGTKQRKLYDQLRKHYRSHLSGKVKELGINKAKIHVLEALLRLRQAACDPRLVNPDCGVRGTKIDELLVRLEELAKEGRKALVFSQFTSLLGLLKQDLDERGWTYEYLDGKTRKRAECVRRFQTDPECKLFLISLKAGGNGLNLTEAEYVFILDPWWNPAVEAQAIDRAHRMGQTRSVNAYRMICEQTVEEKIIELQQTKRDLADAIVGQDKSLIQQLTADDLQALLM